MTSRYHYLGIDYIIRCRDLKFHYSLRWKVIDSKGRYVPTGEYQPCTCQYITPCTFTYKGEAFKAFIDKASDDV